MIQNKRLEDLLQLAPAEEAEQEPTIEETEQLIEDNKQLLAEIDSTIDKIDIALPVIRDLQSDAELDDLASKAVTAFEDLQTLGLNVDPRYSGTIFQTAATMLGHAITAKQSKIDKKLRIIDLQLKKARLDMQKKAAEDKEDNAQAESTGIVIDRNELLKKILDDRQKSAKSD